MPTDRFYKLNDEKRQKIIDAAVSEFTRVNYKEASINQIVQNAGISRGSFYTYFEDKNDLLRLLMEDFGSKCIIQMKEILKKCKGDIFIFFEKLYDSIIHIDDSSDMVRFYKKTFSNLDVIMEVEMAEKRCRYEGHNAALHQISDMLYEYADRKRLKIRQETFASFVELALFATIRCAIVSLKHGYDEKKIKKILSQQLDCMRYGIEKGASDGRK